MAKQIEGVYERILECAKKEFLEKGYMDASLRTIAAEAETSTNSIYVRFKDKGGSVCCHRGAGFGGIHVPLHECPGGFPCI